MSKSAVAGASLMSAWCRSGYCVAEWLPHIVIWRMSFTVVPLLGELGFGAVVVESRHRRKLSGTNVACVALCDQCVGIGGIADYQHFDIAAGDAVDGFSLHAKNRGIGLQQILTLHPGASGSGADKQGVIAVFERNFGVISADDVCEKREGAIVQFHLDAAQRIHRWCDV